MRIIKQGDLNKLKEIKKFTCFKCGCVFEASNSEYKKEFNQREDNTYFKINCPCCQNIVIKSQDYWIDN